MARATTTASQSTTNSKRRRKSFRNFMRRAATSKDGEPRSAQGPDDLSGEQSAGKVTQGQARPIRMTGGRVPIRECYYRKVFCEGGAGLSAELASRLPGMAMARGPPASAA